MLSLSPAVKLWYCPDPVDVRLGFDGLFNLVRNRLKADPLSGHLFILMHQRLLHSRVIHSDDTKVKLRVVGASRQTKKAHLWAYVGDAG
jgi:transposase